MTWCSSWVLDRAVSDAYEHCTVAHELVSFPDKVCARARGTRSRPEGIALHVRRREWHFHDKYWILLRFYDCCCSGFCFLHYHHYQFCATVLR